MTLTPNQELLLRAVKNGLHIYGRDKGAQYKDRRYTFGALAEMRAMAVTQAAHALMRKKMLAVVRLLQGHLLVTPDWLADLPDSEAKTLGAIKGGAQIYGIDRGRQMGSTRYSFGPPNGSKQPCQYLSRAVRSLLSKHLVKITKTPDGRILLEVV